MNPQQEIVNEIVDKGVSGMTEYVMPIVAVLSLMAIFGLRIVKLNGTGTKRYILHITIITSVFIALGIALKLIKEEIAEPIISAIATIVFVWAVVQLLIQIKFKKQK